MPTRPLPPANRAVAIFHPVAIFRPAAFFRVAAIFRVAATLIVAMIIPSAVRADDVVILKSGAKQSGRIVSQDNNVVVLEMQVGKRKVTRKFPRAVILSIMRMTRRTIRAVAGRLRPPDRGRMSLMMIRRTASPR